MTKHKKDNSLVDIHVPLDDREIGDPYSNLGNAIITQAARDYISYLRRGHVYEAKSIERFFRSPLYETLTTLDAEYLISALKAKAARRMR